MTQFRETEPNRTIKPTLVAGSHTIVLLISSLNFTILLKADDNRGDFTIVSKARMAVSGTGESGMAICIVLLLFQ